MIKNDKQFNIYFLLWVFLKRDLFSPDIQEVCQVLETRLKNYLMYYGYSYNQEKLHDLYLIYNLYEKEEIL